MRGSTFTGSGDQLLEVGSEANARVKGILRLEDKDYTCRMHPG